MNPVEWLEAEIDALTDELVQISPSEWAEEYRRLPASVTSRPGPYDYAVTPYLREIVDCLDTRSPTRQVAIMKGAQTGGTVGVLENFLGYLIAHVRTAPVMLVTATQDLAGLRMDEYIMPMIEQSGMSELIQNNSENKRKAGATAKKLSWYGGGFCVPTGSNEASKLRSISARVVALDELDAMPIRVGNDGCPVALAKRRTAAFEHQRKILMISTPTTSEESRILREYNDGDRRVFKVPCLGCGVFSELRWEHKDKKGVQNGGIVWTLDGEGRVVPGSVRYSCPHCGECHLNEHKRLMMPQGRWEATATPIHPSIRSYHISALMSPPGFYSWESAVVDWLKAWNVETKQPRDRELLQEFYNNVLGREFRTGGARLTYAKVARHARSYYFGRVPNDLAATMCGGKIGFLTCSADIQKDFIAVAVYAWGPGRIGYLIDRMRFDGSTDDPLNMAGPWGSLKRLIDDKWYPDGEGRVYDLKLTLVDSGYRTGEVYDFCAQFEHGVFPLKGDDRPQKGPTKEFKRLKEASQAGVDGWVVNVNHYKTRLAAVLRAEPTSSNEPAPVNTVSFPDDLPNEALEELTAEEFVEMTNPRGEKSWGWKRKGRNELWDLTVYGGAARDIVAYMLCREHLELETIIWGRFWEIAESIGFGWADAPPVEKE